MSHTLVDGAPHLVQPDFGAFIPDKNPAWRTIAVFYAASLVLAGFLAYSVLSKIQPVQASPVALPSIQITPEPPQKAADLPTVAQPADKSPELYAVLEAWRKAQTGSDWAFYVKSLDTTEVFVAVNQKVPFTMASLYKLHLLKPLANRVPAEAWDNHSVIGKSYKHCVTIMLSLSDNPCAEAFGNILGWSAMQRQIVSSGYTGTTINSLDNFTTSASDSGLLLERLYTGQGYGKTTRDIALDAMAQPKAIEAIRVGCKDCTAVLNKTGYIANVKHDVGIVIKNDQAFIVVIMSENASWPKLTEAAALITDSL